MDKCRTTTRLDQKVSFFLELPIVDHSPNAKYDNEMLALTQLPKDLPRPEDDGTAVRLIGKSVPSLLLKSTDRTLVDLSRHDPGYKVVFVYPMTGVPGVPLPDGWDSIPGARGCTPQACSFRDSHQEIISLGARVYGLSSQSTEYQREMAERLHLTFPVLSDERFEFSGSLDLPTMYVHNLRLHKRTTLFIRRGVIEHCIHPVFPPDESAAEAITWLRRLT